MFAVMLMPVILVLLDGQVKSGFLNVMTFPNCSLLITWKCMFVFMLCRNKMLLTRWTNSLCLSFVRVSGSRMDLQIHIRPRGRDGLLFWSGEDLSSKSARDYIALGFHAGSLQLRYNLGSGEALISYNHSRLFDGGWHFVRVQR